MLRYWTTFFEIQLDRSKPIYKQIASTIEHEIDRGRLAKDMVMPGSRELAQHLKVSRDSVVQAYDLLISIGKLYTEKQKGTFVSEVKKKKSTAASPNKSQLSSSPTFSFNRFTDAPDTERMPKGNWLYKFDDGLPDPMLAPLIPFTSTYKRIFNQQARLKKPDFFNREVVYKLMESITHMLHQQRGMTISPSQLCFIVGKEMALRLVVQALIKKGEYIAIEEPGSAKVYHILRNAGAQLAILPTDNNGLQTDSLELLCKQKKIKAVYVNPRCQYPTTATLSPERRSELIGLAEKYKFAIIESDYDQEFTYEPLLPLAASGHSNIIYMGVINQTLPPLSLMSFVTGPEPFIQSLQTLYRGVMQEDLILGQAAVALLEEGVITHFNRKAQHLYLEKRELISSTIRAYFNNSFSFSIPKAGLAIWGIHRNFSNGHSLPEYLQRHGIWVPTISKMTFGEIHPQTVRLGFGSLSLPDIEKSIKSLSTILLKTFWPMLYCIPLAYFYCC